MNNGDPAQKLLHNQWLINELTPKAVLPEGLWKPLVLLELQFLLEVFQDFVVVDVHSLDLPILSVLFLIGRR